MKQRIYLDKLTNRVKLSYRGTTEFIEAQAYPDGCYYIETEEKREFTTDWVLLNGQMVYDPIVVEKTYKTLRSESYPAFGDQLDAIMKMALLLKNQNIALPAETIEWINTCLAVKDRYPKP